MSKDEINREDLNTNFLKQTIIRLDYDMLFEKDIEKFIEKIYQYLIGKEYRMNTNTLSSFNVNINMDEANNITNNFNTDNENYSSFINKEGNITLDITKQFIAMNIYYNKFEKFEQILEIFNEVIKYLRDIRIGFSFNRIGIRKINAFGIEHISKINNYIEETTFNFSYKDSKENSSNLIIKNSTEVFTIDVYKVNKNVNVANGIMIDQNKKENSIYQVVLDIDIYNDEIEKNNIDLIKMNNTLFKIYKDSIKEDFLIKMKKTDYTDKEIRKI